MNLAGVGAPAGPGPGTTEKMSWGAGASPPLDRSSRENARPLVSGFALGNQRDDNPLKDCAHHGAGHSPHTRHRRPGQDSQVD